MEHNIDVMEGTRFPLCVTLQDGEGNALAGDGFRVYGGACCPGMGSVVFPVSRSGGEFVVMVPGLAVGRMPWRYQVFVVEQSTGVEWLLCSGEVRPEARCADASGGVSAGSLTVTGVLDRNTLSLGVQLGESTVLCRELLALAEAAAGRAEAAAGRAEAVGAEIGKAYEAAARAEDSKSGAEAAAGDAADAAQLAEGKAAEAEVSREAAEVAATLAGDRAAEAEASAQVAADAVSDAQTARDEAVLAKTGAEAAQAEAQTAEGNAKASANAAAADKAAAEQAKTDAQAAQRQAELEAGKAEQNAALLGDAALKSADNVFSGQNVFNGISNMLPADFWRYDCCTTLAEVREMAGKDETFENWNYPLKNLNVSNGGSPFVFNNRHSGKRIYLYCEKEGTRLWGTYVQHWNGDELIVYFPNMSGSAYHGFHDINIKKATIILPKITYLGQYFFNNADISDLCLVTGAQNTNVREFWTYGGGESRVKVLRLPNNKLQSFRWENSSGMVTVTNGFPNATLVNIQKSKLDKASVLRIVNSLKPYDASTMAAVPELTLGIDPALEGDEEINAALLNAQEAVENGGKGWNVAVSGFTITAGTGAATMGLRRLVYVKFELAADGGYIDAEGQRWNVRWGNTVLENWQANEELGYEAFPCVEAALDEWGLRELTMEEAKAANETLPENK